MQANYDDEIIYLESRLKENPESMLFARLADHYLKRKEIEKAIELCERGLGFHPSYASAYYVLAKCFFHRDEWEHAERRLKKVLALEPRFLTAQKLYGDLLAKQGWKKSSEKVYRNLVDIDPTFSEVTPIPIEEPELEETPIEEGFFESGVENKVENLPEPPMPQTPLEKLTEQVPSRDTTVPEFDAFTEPKFDQELDVEMGDLSLPKVDRDEDKDLNLVQDLESDRDTDYQGDDFERAEARFSNILDDIFSPQMRQEEEARSRVTLKNLEEASPFIDHSGEEPTPASPPAPIRSEMPKVDHEFDDLSETPFVRDRALEDSLADDREFVQHATRDEERDDLLSFDDYLAGMEQRDSRKEPDPEPDSLSNDEGDLEESYAAVPEADDSELFDSQTDQEPSQPTTEESFRDLLSTLEEDDELAVTDDDNKDATAAQTTESERDFTPADQESENVETTDRTKEKFVTPTLGEIYAAQGQYEKAIDVFEMLSRRHPDNEWYQTKLQYLRKRLQEEREQ
ncbi:tetratricopeptide repeat protein [candidate division KSB1 bacterium]|nr:tetratricopeptide repeat protein [candidate division KSB1 bacterium]